MYKTFGQLAGIYSSYSQFNTVVSISVQDILIYHYWENTAEVKSALTYFGGSISPTTYECWGYAAKTVQYLVTWEETNSLSQKSDINNTIKTFSVQHQGT